MIFEKNKRGYLEISFGWMFALIVGGVILFLAIFAVVKIINTEGSSQDIQKSVELGALTNPLEIGIEDGSSHALSLKGETRISVGCDSTFSSGSFGFTSLNTNTKVFDKWTDSKGELSLQNKYIFSDGLQEGEKFYFFTQPFEYPFKISSLIYLTSSKTNYCFFDAPEEIISFLNKSENGNFFQDNLRIDGSGCRPNSINVCFQGGSDCDIFVRENRGEVIKGGEKLDFEGEALMFAAIFSEKKLYDCQLSRLANRGRELASIYKEKSSLTGCGSNLNLGGLENSFKNFESFSSSGNFLQSISSEVESIKRMHDRSRSSCKLW